MKKISLSMLILALLGFFTLTSCGNDASSDNAKKEVNEAVEAVGDALISEKNDLKGEIIDAQDDIDRRLEKLNNDIKAANKDASAGIQRNIEKLETKKAQLAQALEDFGNKADSEWAQFSANVREMLKDIGNDNN